MYQFFLVSLLLLCSRITYAELHDPTRPPDYIEKQSGFSENSAFILGLTLISPSRKIVIINGQTLKPGDEINGYKISAIQLNSVQLTGTGGNITLFLLDKSVKQALPR